MKLSFTFLGVGLLVSVTGAMAQDVTAESSGPRIAATLSSDGIAMRADAVKVAPSVDLLVTYQTRLVGRDGVTREAIWSQRMHRRQAMLWLERDMPAALQQSQSHGHDHEDSQRHASHPHNDAQSAPMLLSIDSQGKVAVRMVQRDKRRVIHVDEGHHGNVGYGGDWDANYWIVPPRMLQAMERQGLPKVGVQPLRSKVGEMTTIVHWDVAGQFPRLLERKDTHGTSLYRVTARRIQAPAVEPWQGVDGYLQGDYSDLLD